MSNAKSWGSGGNLNKQAIDLAGAEVAAKWWDVVRADDGGTDEDVQNAIDAAEQAEKDFRAEWN